jgi:hypothetical protein
MVRLGCACACMTGGKTQIEDTTLLLDVCIWRQKGNLGRKWR